MEGKKNGHRRADPADHGSSHDGTASRYAAAIALEDAREAARAALAARARALTDDPEVIEGEIIGWRWWGYNPRSGLLQSPFQHTLWLPDKPMYAGSRDATTRLGPGIYAFKHREQAWKNRGIYIVGSVWLWGDMVEHENGYRAEFARVRSIDWVSCWTTHHTVSMFYDIRGRRVRRRLRRKYGVT